MLLIGNFMVIHKKYLQRATFFDGIGLIIYNYILIFQSGVYGLMIKENMLYAVAA